MTEEEQEPTMPPISFEEAVEEVLREDADIIEAAQRGQRMMLQDTARRDEAAARKTARRLMTDPSIAMEHEPTGPLECHAAVDELAAAFSGAGATFKEIVDNSRSGAESLSTDSFQGLSEIVQNANDVGATRVAFILMGNVLEVLHNGRPVNLRDLRAMSVPWLTTKTDDPDATGRFGVGLSTLHAVAETFEVHSGHYHVRIGDPFLTNLDDDPRDEDHWSDTVLRVAFKNKAVSEDEFLAWCERWDDSALIFLTHVGEVSFATTTAERTLRLTTEPVARLSWEHSPEGAASPIHMSRVRAPDGRGWLLATCEVASPEGVERTRKHKGETTPLGVALPLYERIPTDGCLYAGLPVVGLPGIAALINAQFDPVTARQGLLGTAWNFALASLVDGLWDCAIRYLFEHRPEKAWPCIPLCLPAEVPHLGQAAPTGNLTGDLVARVGSRIRDRANDLASSLIISVDGAPRRLARLAVESEDLRGLLTDEEIVGLSATEDRLPDAARDGNGRWRAVLRHWREQVADLPPEVTIHDALRLLDNPRRSVRDVIRLTAVALDHELETDLRALDCIVDDSGQAHHPPSSTSPFALTPSLAGLASDLGLAITLHPAYLEADPAAASVREWLRVSRCLIETDSDLPMLERLAAAEQPVEDPFDDARLIRLRVALEPLDNPALHRLGRGIGRMIFVSGYQFTSDGATVTRPIRPCDAYQPKRIDTVKDGFFTAATDTPGLVWVANRYADVLKSDLPRGAGLGAQKFLRALGVATTARVVPHPGLQRKYMSSRRLGLPSNQWGASPEWRRALADLDADYTLDDWDSPDLIRVLNDIAADKSARRRRDRANAMIETLGRAWRDLGDFLEVDAAWAMHQWNVRGQVRAWWLWKAASIAWLDNAEGAPTTPMRLRRRSTANLAVFGDTPETFLHKDLTLARPEVLIYLGVAREPSTSDLIQRLRSLRENPTETAYAECATVYVALATRASEGSIGRTARQLRDQLSERGGLIRTTTRWAAPGGLLRGLPVFGQRRDFTPSIPGAEPLWRFLQVPEPRTDDCLGVLGEIAKTRQPISDDDEAIVLQTLRVLDALLAPRRTETHGRRSEVSNRVKNRLGSLPLWTSQGWVNKRPVFAVQDPQLMEGIGDALPIWTPAADPAQFRRLFPLLKLTPIDSSHVAINDPNHAHLDDDATVHFQRALRHFKADLTRNAPDTEQSLTVPWSTLESMDVRVHPLLEATVTPPAGKSITISMHAKFEPSQGALFLRDEGELDRVDGVGRALAALFTADERNLAYTWLAAVLKEREGQRVRALELATERQARETQDAQDQMDRLRDLQTEVQEAATKKATKTRSTTKPPGKTAPTTEGTPASTTPPPRQPRYLVDIDSLVVTNAAGEIVNEEPQARTATPAPGKESQRPTDRDDARLPGARVAEPDRSKNPPRPSTTYRAYSDEEKERLGLKIASRVLAGDADALIDIRNQRSVGADAIDDLGKFYELKVFANDEGDTVTLEPSQIARAMSEPKFFLVIVSHLEGKQARPQVRVIVDPLRQLSMAKESRVKFSGLQEARGLVFTLDNQEDGDT